MSWADVKAPDDLFLREDHSEELCNTPNLSQ